MPAVDNCPEGQYLDKGLEVCRSCVEICLPKLVNRWKVCLKSTTCQAYWNTTSASSSAYGPTTSTSTSAYGPTTSTSISAYWPTTSTSISAYGPTTSTSSPNSSPAFAASIILAVLLALSLTGLCTLVYMYMKLRRSPSVSMHLNTFDTISLVKDVNSAPEQPPGQAPPAVIEQAGHAPERQQFADKMCGGDDVLPWKVRAVPENEASPKFAGNPAGLEEHVNLLNIPNQQPSSYSTVPSGDVVPRNIIAAPDNEASPAFAGNPVILEEHANLLNIPNQTSSSQ